MHLGIHRAIIIFAVEKDGTQQRKITGKQLKSLKKVKKVVDSRTRTCYDIKVAAQKKPRGAAMRNQSLPAEKSAPALQDRRFTFPILYENQTEMQP